MFADLCQDLREVRSKQGAMSNATVSNSASANPSGFRRGSL